MRPPSWWHVAAVAVLFVCAIPARAAESIAGQVVHAITGSPLRRVSLTATRIDGKGEPVKTQVDDNGQFVFRDLAPGGYLLSGARNGFDRQVHGSRLNPNIGTVLLVRNGLPIMGVVFRMFPKAAISGRVLDVDGEPVANAGVSVFQRGYHNGKQDWYLVAGADTNSRGEYRVHGLGAGRYVVSAAGTSALPATPERVNAITYYPGMVDFERAELVAVARGDDRRGVDIRLIRAPSVHVCGRITGVPENTLVVVCLLPKAGSRVLTAVGLSVVVPRAGSTFKITGVRPGSYWLAARSMSLVSFVSTPLSVEIGDRHIDNVELTLGEGGEFVGRVLSDAGVAGVLVEIETPDFFRLSAATANVSASGEFKLRGIYSIPYRLRVAMLPKDTYVRTVKLAGQVVDADNIAFSPGAILEILLGKASAELKGVVLDADGTPFAGASVVLIPESGRDDLYRETTSDYDGTFSIKSVAPGRYRAIAWEDIDPDAFHDPEVVKLVKDRAAPVTLTGDARGEVTLKVIPAERQ